MLEYTPDRRSDPRRQEIPALHRVTHELPEHLVNWELPPGWRWGTEGVHGEHRHYQELIDALGRSLSLVSATDPEHFDWLTSEARHLAHRNHPAVPTTYHYWVHEARRGPGYLRRWIAGERVTAQIARQGPYDIPTALRILRSAGAALAYLHDTGMPHSAIGPETLWVAPTGRLWLLGWQWAVPPTDIPGQLSPDSNWTPHPPEWSAAAPIPTPASDQWQLAALCFAALTGELPPATDVPPIQLMRPEVPAGVAQVIDRALQRDPATRHPSVASMLRGLERAGGSRSAILTSGEYTAVGSPGTSEEGRLRWAAGDDYEVRAALGSGSFGSVWRVRDLALEREVALKMLHPHVARDQRAVGRFRREAQLAAQLAHPAIVPIYDWDSRGEVSWYTMELAEGGSLAELIARSGPRSLGEMAPQVDLLLDGLVTAHAVGIIHRDLKPENILIDRYRRWRIADFGIAHAWEETGGSTGTPAFAAPEQLLGEPQGPNVDCFSLAGIVVFALSGALPFGGGDAKVILARELTGNIDLSPYPEEIADWLRHGLAAAPEKRFADAIEMQQAWREAMDTAFRRDHLLPWWRRWLGGEQEAGPLPLSLGR
ncbi:MAG TPA: serine/threonine-protein kinase [Gemmatimonadaceae bacterium]|nr:serine/threonine-protein kinase [Gemmatimonadaceae bacterium]